METIYTWKIDNVTTVEDGIVKTVFWTLTAERSGFTERTSGATTLGEPGPSPVPFADLTQEMVAGWIESVMEPGYPDQLKDFLSDQISYHERFSGLATNFVDSQSLPWAESVPR